ncbi:MAG: biotin/lipoyl-binding protein [Anaerolineaceae bacterium]|nr:biotin/lipoyl-binding protein [Anaerolineaceae bacterium]
MKYITTINEKTFEVEIDKNGSVTVNGEPREVDFLELGGSLYSLIMNDQSFAAVIDGQQGHYEVQIQGRLFEAEVLDERSQLMLARTGGGRDDSGEVAIKSPMPGLIVAIPVAEGQEVEAGQTIIILESMKMQNELKAPRNGIVARIHVTPGQTVEQKKTLVTIT